MKTRYHVFVQGIVQGVGFRPFIYQQAKARNLSGYVTNTSQGVELEVEGEVEVIEDFLRVVQNTPPPLSRITGLQAEVIPLINDSEFSIGESIVREERSALISPDTATCADCLRELRDPSDRRFEYPVVQQNLWEPVC